MPKDQNGKFHLNYGRMHSAQTAKPMERPKTGMMAAKDSAPPQAEHEGGEPGMAHTTLHDHGDGTFHTEGHDGEKVDHPHIGHALMHMAGKHDGGAKHMHIHHDGMSMTSHHHADGATEGPHDHENMEALKEHMGKFFDEEEHEGGGGGHSYEEQPASHSLHGM